MAISSAVSAPISRPGRRAQCGDALIADRRLLAQPVAHDRRPRRRGDEPDVGRLAGEGQPDGLLVPDALAGDDDVGRGIRIEPTDVGRAMDPLGTRERVGLGDRIDDRHLPAGGRAERRQRPGDRRRADEPEVRGGQMRFHVDLQRATRVAGHDELDDAVGAAALARAVARQPQQPRLAVAEGAQSLADDDRLGAAAADPALDVPSGWTIPLAPGRADVGRRTATTVATANGRPAASSSAARAKVEPSCHAAVS